VRHARQNLGIGHEILVSPVSFVCVPVCAMKLP
jgi:hypothetical protein